MNDITWTGQDHMRPSSPLAQEAERLIRLYPNLDSYEVHLLAEIIPQLSILETGTMTSDDAVARRLAAFQKEHGHLIKTPVWHWLIPLIIPATFALLLASALLWT